MDRRRQATAPDGQVSSAVATAQQKGDQIVPSNSLARKASAAPPGRAVSRASSSVASQTPEKQGSRQGWEMHRELLIRRSEQFGGLQEGSPAPPLSVFLNTLTQPSGMPLRQRMDASYASAQRNLDSRKMALQRRQNYKGKLPEGIPIPYHLDSSRPKQLQSDFGAKQSQGRLVSAAYPRAASFPCGRQEVHPSHEDLWMANGHHGLKQETQQAVSHSRAPGLGFACARQGRQPIPVASSAAGSKHTATWLSLEPPCLNRFRNPSTKRLHSGGHSPSDAALQKRHTSASQKAYFSPTAPYSIRALDETRNLGQLPNSTEYKRPFSAESAAMRLQDTELPLQKAQRVLVCLLLENPRSQEKSTRPA